jgi:hypothetical protein
VESWKFFENSAEFSDDGDGVFVEFEILFFENDRIRDVWLDESYQGLHVIAFKVVRKDLKDLQ